MVDAPPPPSNESWFATLDRVLRGSFLGAQDLAVGRVEAPVGRLLAWGLLLGAIYGVCIGGFALFHGGEHPWLQTFANAWKVPLLFVLTLVITLPSLYVFSALQRLPLDFRVTLRVLLLAILVHLCVTASLGPVFVFFAASTGSYPFLLLMNVLFFAIGGLLGCMVLRRAVRQAAGETRRLLGIWCLVYGVVGAQTGWLLRPFLGKPGLPFEWFRSPEDNVLIGIFRTIGDLFR